MKRRKRSQPKICLHCQQPLTEENWRQVRKTGNISSICISCKSKQKKAQSESFYAQPDKLAHRREKMRAAYHGDPQVRECRLALTRKWKAERPHYREECKLKKYGLTLAMYEEMLDRQEGGCAICRKPPSIRYNGKIKRLAVDHDHATGKVRELLCDQCNGGLGLFADDIEIISAAIRYLIKHRTIPAP